MADDRPPNTGKRRRSVNRRAAESARPLVDDTSVRLTFPQDRVVGTLDWPTRDHEQGPVLATGPVDVPNEAEISLEVQPIIDVQHLGNDRWNLRADTKPISLAFLADLPPDSIANLSLHRVAPNSMRAVAHLAPGLRRLYLVSSGLGDDALTHVAELTGLVYLQTFGNHFTDHGVQQLASLRQARDLYLEEQTLTAAAFTFALELPFLRRLGLQDVPISPDELSSLRRQMPSVDVG